MQSNIFIDGKFISYTDSNDSTVHRVTIEQFRNFMRNTQLSECVPVDTANSNLTVSVSRVGCTHVANVGSVDVIETTQVILGKGIGGIVRDTSHVEPPVSHGDSAKRTEVIIDSNCVIIQQPNELPYCASLSDIIKHVVDLGHVYDRTTRVPESTEITLTLNAIRDVRLNRVNDLSVPAIADGKCIVDGVVNVGKLPMGILDDNTFLYAVANIVEYNGHQRPELLEEIRKESEKTNFKVIIDRQMQKRPFALTLEEFNRLTKVVPSVGEKRLSIRLSRSADKDLYIEFIGVQNVSKI